jgi:hypothetical protein
MKKSLTALSENFNTIRTGRANPAILDRIQVRLAGSACGMRVMGAQRPHRAQCTCPCCAPTVAVCMQQPHPPTSQQLLRHA